MIDGNEKLPYNKGNKERSAGMAKGVKREDGKKPQTVASNKYNSKAYDKVSIMLKKGNRDILRYYCELNEISMNKLIIDCINKCTDLNLE